MTKKKGVPIELYGTERDLFDLLKNRYPAPSWALIPQVANGTGAQLHRWADAVALSCWPSMGLELHGFEIKTYRADWLRELKDGAKSQEIWQFCDRWWIVVRDKDLVGPGELPKTWGLLAPKGRTLQAFVAAPLLKPKPLTKSFVASVLRNAMEIAVPEALLREEHKKGAEEGRKEAEEAAKYEKKSLEERLAAMEKAIQAFEKAAGVEFPHASSWMSDFSDHEAFGAAVRQVLAGQDGEIVRKLIVVRDLARKLADLVDDRLSKANVAVGSSEESPDAQGQGAGRD